MAGAGDGRCSCPTYLRYVVRILNRVLGATGASVVQHPSIGR